jgi:hypothetical protein
MSIHKFQLGGYKILLGGPFGAVKGDPQVQALGSILCEGEDDVEAYRVTAYFLVDGSPAPAPTLVNDGHDATLWLPRDLMAVWIDLLRNERPVYGYIDTNRPASTRITTDQMFLEPIGEGEG